MYDAEDEDDKLETIHCTHCGSPLVKMSEGSQCGLTCPRCKEEFMISMKEGDIIVKKRTARGKRRASLKA